MYIPALYPLSYLARPAIMSVHVCRCLRLPIRLGPSENGGTIRGWVRCLWQPLAILADLSCGCGCKDARMRGCEDMCAAWLHVAVCVHWSGTHDVRCPAFLHKPGSVLRRASSLININPRCNVYVGTLHPHPPVTPSNAIPELILSSSPSTLGLRLSLPSAFRLLLGILRTILSVFNKNWAKFLFVN